MSFLDNNPMSFIFGAKPGAGVPTYEQLQMRRKIAESLLGQKSRYPKTFGEGLGAIGEAIGERGMMNRLDEMERAKAAQDKAAMDEAMGNPAGAAPTARPMSYAPPDEITTPPSPPLVRPPVLPPAPGNLPPTGEPGNTGATTFPPPFQTTPAQRDAMPPGAGPRSDMVDPGLNQSVALNQTAPPASSGPPMALSGQSISDAPPIGMPPPPDARAAIAGGLTPRPSPVVAPPVPPPPPGPQIAQAPPQQQIRVPEKEPTPPPPPQATDTMRKIERALATIGDPMKRDILTKRYNQEWADEQATYNQKLKDFEYKRAKFDTAPERAATLQKAQQEAIKAKQEADVATRTGGLGNEAVLAPVAKNQEKVSGVPSASQALRSARAQLEQGIFTGTGAEQKLAIAKSKQALASAFGLDANDPKIASTETFKAAVMPLVAQARSAIAGNANISDADVNLAMSAAGGNIALDAKTFPKVLDALERINLGLAVGHQGKVSAAAAGNETAAQALHGVYGLPMEEIIPPRFIQRLKEHPETAGDFDKTFKTPGLARKILGQ